jgi:hypothetical protein
MALTDSARSTVGPSDATSRGLRPAPGRQPASIPELSDPGSRLDDATRAALRSAPHAPGARRTPREIPVPRVGRDFRVKIASERSEWREAYRLVATNYQARGYEAPYASKVRFTPYHALPDTVTFVAKHAGRVHMTLSLVPDNTLLGLPLESIYAEEVRQLRRERRRLAEVVSLAADKDVNMREFRQIFVAIIRLMKQYHVSHGGDTWVITVNPRHRDFYCKALGYVPLGPPRAYAAVEDHPAEAYMVDAKLMRANAPKMHDEVFGESLPGDALVAPKMLPHLVRYLASQTSESSGQRIREVFNFDEFFNSPRRW